MQKKMQHKMGPANWPSRKEVQNLIQQAWTSKAKTELIDTEDAIGRIAAEDVFSQHDLPVVRASAMDGIGVKSSLFQEGFPETERWRPGVEYERADTGDDFPDCYDAVIPIEQVTILENGGIRLKEDVQVKPGMHVRPRGSMLAKGELLVKKRTKLTPSDLASLVAGGISKLTVLKRPVITFIPTGSELIPAGEELTRGKNIDSNSILVKHMLLEMGASPLCFPIVPDDMLKLEQALDRALKQSDIVLLSGGSSKGGEDYTAVLLKKKGKLICHNVAAAPGRPICAAVINEKLVVDIPGPSLACYYSMDWCIRFAVDMFLHQEESKRQTILARLMEDVRSGPGMEILCKMEVKRTEEGYEAHPIPGRTSSIAKALAASGQYITDPKKNLQSAGTMLEIELLRDENQTF